jgi:hypothetical protein
VSSWLVSSPRSDQISSLPRALGIPSLPRAESPGLTQASDAGSSQNEGSLAFLGSALPEACDPGTTTSADFSLRLSPLPFQARGEISPGKNDDLPLIWLSDLRGGPPDSIGLHGILTTRPGHLASYPLLVHQPESLPLPSSRFPIAQDTLGFG